MADEPFIPAITVGFRQSGVRPRSILYDGFEFFPDVAEQRQGLPIYGGFRADLETARRARSGDLIAADLLNQMEVVIRAVDGRTYWPMA